MNLDSKVRGTLTAKNAEVYAEKRWHCPIREYLPFARVLNVNFGIRDESDSWGM